MSTLMRNSPPPVVADEEDHHHHTTTAETATATAVTVTATATATAETTTTTTTTKTTPVQQEAETNPGQVLFGSMNSELSDALAESLHKAILKGVESLPLLQQTLPLIKRIETPFLKCVDVMEEYARRNIFSLQGIPLKRQQVIVQRVLLGKEEGTATTTTTTTTTAAITEHPAAAYDYPTQDQIPSSASIQALKEDIQQLQELLKTSKKRRDELLLQTAGLGLAQRLSTKAVDSLQCLPLEEETTTLNVVTEAVRGGKQAQEYTQDSQHLQTRLDHTHKNRAKENEEEDLVPHPKKKRLSLEEEYRQERQIATLDSLSAIQNLLKH